MSITTEPTAKWEQNETLINEAANKLADCGLKPSLIDAMAKGVAGLQVGCHRLAVQSGWWTEHDEMPEQYRKYFLGTKIALIHSETSELLEGNRKGRADDHLPHRPAEEVEAADILIRLMDYCGKRGFDLSGAVIEKLAYDQQRPDHKPENRAAEGGKGF